MTSVFCDTSILAKYYVSEPETPIIRKRLDEAEHVLASELARVELMAVFHRRLREGKWTQKEFLACVRQFQRDDMSGYWSWCPLTTIILEQAMEIFLSLPKDIFLRSSDCLHLVTAIHNGIHSIYTHDKHQMLAAVTLGLNVL